MISPVYLGVQWLSGRVLVEYIYPSLVLVQPRKTRPCLTERLLMGREGSNLTNKTKSPVYLNCSKIVE